MLSVQPSMKSELNYILARRLFNAIYIYEHR
jgi:hypothetical protein